MVSWMGFGYWRKKSVQKLIEIQSEISGTCLIWKASIGEWHGHTGGMDGIASVAEIHPGSNTGLIIICNKKGGNVYPGEKIYGLVRQKANN